MYSDLAAAIRWFPSQKQAIEERAARDETFRSICADLADAEVALTADNRPASVTPATPVSSRLRRLRPWRNALRVRMRLPFRRRFYRYSLGEATSRRTTTVGFSRSRRAGTATIRTMSRIRPEEADGEVAGSQGWAGRRSGSVQGALRVGPGSQEAPERRHLWTWT